VDDNTNDNWYLRRILWSLALIDFIEIW
jgi:hypothetical protein